MKRWTDGWTDAFQRTTPVWGAAQEEKSLQTCQAEWQSFNGLMDFESGCFEFFLIMIYISENLVGMTSKYENKKVILLKSQEQGTKVSHASKRPIMLLSRR